MIVANHPFGIGDGIAILSLAEQLGRPFRVMIASELLKIKEMEPYSLPVDFSGTKEALKNNLAIRHEAVRLLKSGVTIVVFPAGGVATAPKGFGDGRGPALEDVSGAADPGREGVGRADAFLRPERPTVPSRQPADEPRRSAEGRLAKMVGKVSLALRLSLLVREFARLSGKTIDVSIGRTLRWDELEPLRDRKALLDELKRAVFELAPPSKPRRRRIAVRFRRRPRVAKVNLPMPL